MLAENAENNKTKKKGIATTTNVKNCRSDKKLAAIKQWKALQIIYEFLAVFGICH